MVFAGIPFWFSTWLPVWTEVSLREKFTRFYSLILCVYSFISVHFFLCRIKKKKKKKWKSLHFILSFKNILFDMLKSPVGKAEFKELCSDLNENF